MVVGLNVVNYSPARRRSPLESTMQQFEIFQPFFAMMLLTLVVWIHMYVIRTRYLVANRVDGVVSIGDLVKAVMSEQQVLIEQLQHYISG